MIKVNRHRVGIIAVVFSVAALGKVTAQDDTPQGGDIDLDVVIVGDVDLFLSDANKVTKAPEVIESVVELTSMTYNLLPRKPQQEIELKPVPAAKINMEEKMPNLFRGYAKGAVGANLTGLGEIRFMDGYNRNGTFDSYMKYYTTDGFVSEADSIADSYSDFSIGVTGKRFLKKHSVGIDIDYNREKVHYYGYDPEVFAQNFGIDEKRIYRTFDAGVNLRSYFRDSTKMNYIGSADFIQFSDNVNGSENNFIVNTDFNKYVKFENYALGVNIDYNLLKNISPRTEAEQKFNNTIITLNPKITTNRNGFMARIGAKLTGDFNDGMKPHIYPDIEVKYSLFDGIFIPYAGLGGELHKNRYRTLADENPFIQNFIREDVLGDVLNNTNEKVNIYGGIRGNISSDMSFNTTIQRASFDDFVFFVNDTLITSANRFRTEYGELKRTTVTGELTYNMGEKIRFFAKGDFFVYDENPDQEPWNQPNNKITLSASYNVQDKIIAKLDVFSMGKRTAKSLAPIEGGTLSEDGNYFTYELDSFIDATLKAEYRYTKRLAVFAQLNNFLFSNYVKYNNYPVQRFNFLGGATYSF